MPYNLNFQSPFANAEEQMLFNQFKMQMQFNQFSQQQQQQPNQANAFQPQSDQQSFHLVDETEDENEDEPVPTPTSKKTSRDPRLKSKSKKSKEKETQVETKRARYVWSQEEELLLAECFIQVSEDPRIGTDKKNDTFWYKIRKAYNAEAMKRGYMERTKNKRSYETC
ncbi:hypothetical protein Tco_0741352 [Tanacetum coccineum]